MNTATTAIKKTAVQSWTAMRRWRMRSPMGVAAVAILAVAVVVAGTFTALAKTVTITVDGATQKVTTLSQTVGGALDSAGLEVGDHDALAPAAASSISSGSQIVLDRGREFTVTLDGNERTVWTTEQTVGGALEQLGEEITNLDVSTALGAEIPLTGLAVVADTFHTVTLRVTQAATAQNGLGIDDLSVSTAAVNPAARSGQIALTAKQPRQVETVITTAYTVADLLDDRGITIGPKQRVTPDVDEALTDDLVVHVETLPTVRLAVGGDEPNEVITDVATVADLLDDQNITLGKHDEVTPDLDTALTENLPVTVTVISYEKSTKAISLKQPKGKTVNDATMKKGTKKVTQEGHAGKAEVTYKTKIVNGKAGKAKEVDRKVLVEAIPTITKVGTKSEQPARTGSGQGPAPAGVWAQLAQCESGGRPGTNTGNGYYGLYQFSLPTWRSVGGSGLPSDASAAEQTKRAEILQARSGWGQWPACTRMLGLR